MSGDNRLAANVHAGAAGSNPDPAAPLHDANGPTHDAIAREPSAQGAVPGEAETAPPQTSFDDTITGEIAALIDDGRTYAEAELAFQKTRAKLTGRTIAITAVCVVLAIVLLHIAFLALAVGLVIALAPLVTTWGAIAIVVGGLMVLVGLLGWQAKSSGQKIARLFASPPKDDAA